MDNLQKRYEDSRKLAYSIAEAADLLGVSCGHLRNENARGKLKFAKSGRRILILETELLRYLNSYEEISTGKTDSGSEVPND